MDRRIGSMRAERTFAFGFESTDVELVAVSSAEDDDGDDVVGDDDPSGHASATAIAIPAATAA